MTDQEQGRVNNTPDTPADANAEADLAALTHRLETLVAAVDKLQAEITALKAELPPKDEDG
ncbi:MAG: hypothetical protein HZC41_23485 [Chloroflexi bacterium]|nr:hypothetical protein [Chloroflexota bacterium]